MSAPSFFSDVPTIDVHDPLADVLGAFDGGEYSFSYADAVRLAGHSCPTVAGAWLMLLGVKRELYGDEPLARGDLKVTMSAGVTDGVTGVIASVFTLVTGAAAGGGFAGLAGQHGRRAMLTFDGRGAAIARFERVSDGQVVEVTYDPSSVPGTADMTLLPRILAGKATGDERQAFGSAWQARVGAILLHHTYDPDVVMVRRA